MSEQRPSVVAFARLLRAHASLTRAFSAELEASHGLSISDYEVLLRLALEPERRMKRVDLAASVVLTPSGITRLLDRLEKEGLVDRAACPSDRRVTYAVLTDDGHRRLRAASADHFAAVDAAFASRLGDDETEQLADLLGRLDGSSDPDVCGPPPEPADAPQVTV